MNTLFHKPQPTLRPYQQKALTMTYEWFNHHSGNPCIEMPTGSGKSHVIAAFCKDAITNYPDTRILMLTHVKELIEQNAEKLKLHWPNAPLGIYSAGLGRKDLDQITYAGIQSIRKKADLIGHIDIILVDEAHTISHKAQGGYRMLIDDLTKINPMLKVVGYTATPFRLGHGMITDDPAIFDDIIKPTSIEELRYHGYLANLKSKITKKAIITTGVHKRGGEFIEKELQEAVDTDDNNIQVVDESIALASEYERLHWLFFCVGVDHAIHIRDLLRSRGITAETVSAKTPKLERDQIFRDYKAGKIQAITNTNVLTTGFDYPDIDMIVMMRPTMSPGLYMQMAGRGLRLKSHTDYCLVLDFAGVVQKHGPITNVTVPKKAGTGDGIAPSKICPNCDEIIFAGLMICPNCEYKFPPPEERPMDLHDDDIMGDGSKVMEVTSWRWLVHTSRKGDEMLKVTYYGDLMQKPVREYLCVMHGGWAGNKAMQKLVSIATKSGASIMHDSLEELCEAMQNSRYPSEVVYKKNGNFFDIIDRIFGEQKIMAFDEEEEEQVIWF